ncbi:transcription initiation factor TFIID subunit 5 [Senna tora]|uniref:Transcription initiation factor TFIID subunit 5 n=1 Tax=Senna tora TaxID=362788 RepID=A0A834SJR9_9FABA|nr:transcription initiation factor TFIID subunit 5 [Senna tora]
MLRLKAHRPTADKIVKIQLHPTHPWMVTADASDRVCVWNWEHRQVIYELKAGGVDQRRLVGAKLEKLAEGETDHKGKPTEAIRGGSVKQVNFFDDDVHFWQLWLNRAAAAEAPSAVHLTSAFSPPAPSTKGRHFLVICCLNKAIFLDLVTMRGRDIPKQELDNKSLLCMEFLYRSSVGDGPLVAFGGSDGVIRVLSMMTWKLVRRYTGGHKGSISCLKTFIGASGEVFLVSGASDGLLIVWSADHGQDSRELVPKLSLKAHDGGVVSVEISRVTGSAPQLITIGADKTLVIWDSVSFKELRRIKPVPKLACHSVASWCHPRAPNLDILTCVKDSHIWAIENPTYSAITRPLCELTSVIPPHSLAPNKKLRVYCMVAHTLQPHIVATGTNIGVIVCEFDARSLPSVAPLPTPSDGRDHSAVYLVGRELKLLNFHLNHSANPSVGNSSSLSETGRSKGDYFEPLPVSQGKKHISTPIPHDSYSVLSVSSSGKYLAIVWPDIPYFSVYKVSDWSIVDSGIARLLSWDTCRDRFAILESALPPRIPIIPKGSSSKKAREAAAAQAAAAAAASAASTASVQVRILLDDGTSNILTRSVGARSEPIIGLHGGALLGVAYRTSRRVSSSISLSGYGGSGVSSFTTFDDGFSSRSIGDPMKSELTEVHASNYCILLWETFEPIGGLLPQPEWTVWDQTVEYCAFAYHQYIVISCLRPQYRYLGDVAIPNSTSAVWHRRQLFVATPTTLEIVFVDAGVAQIDIETKRMKEEQKIKEAQARAVAEHGDLALITVDGPQATKEERISLRPPMLQVVRLASFQHAPSVPPFLTLPKQYKFDSDDSWMTKAEERKASEVAVGGGGVSVAVTRFPMEQKRPVGPLIVVGVRDGVLWLIDRYMCAHALSLNHPGIRCRCLAAYGDAVSAVKWASRLGREHHDDLAQFMLGMGYATEALHLPGISKRLEFDLAMKSNDLKRALQCLLIMSNSRDIGHDSTGLGLNDILNLKDKKEDVVEAVQGIVKFAKEFLDLIDAADATAQIDIAREALKRLAAAGSVKGALQGHELRGLALRLANHGELTRLSGLVNNLVTLGLGREAAFAAGLLGDNALMEKAWQDTGMLAEAVLHAHAHGRPTLMSMAQAWNQMLQRAVEPTKSHKTDATAAFLASLEEPKLTTLAEAGKKPPIEVLPPGMVSLSAPISIQKKPAPAAQNSQQQPAKPLALEAPPPPTTTSVPMNALKQSASTTTTPPTTATAPMKALNQSESSPTLTTTTTDPINDSEQSESTPTLPTTTTEPMNALNQSESTPTLPTTTLVSMNAMKQSESTPTLPTATSVSMNAMKQSESTPTLPTATSVPMNAMKQSESTPTTAIVPMNALKQPESTPTTTTTVPSTSDSIPTPKAIPSQIESGETIVDNGAHSASASDVDPIARGENVQATSTSNSSQPDVPPQLAEGRESSVPTTVPPKPTSAPLSDFLA